ncbi:hypothetical protein ACEUZ9_004684 [Paracoccus litorisediminis]|uniref:hypothetical protein n=1 Tax=Paracoccus litorisediminis TaxID=2006130 RepID=UPI003733737C
MSAIVIGLAGFRQVGKSHVADHLVRHHGFVKVHPFDGGKAMARTYYERIGIDTETAWQMTDGKMKDTPCALLPGGVPSRFFMEKFGEFMGVVMGPEWTMGKEIECALKKGHHQRLLVESLVYEDQTLRALGGQIWKVERPSVVGTPGLKTDAYTAKMVVDAILMNDFETHAELYDEVDRFVEERLGLVRLPEAVF